MLFFLCRLPRWKFPARLNDLWFLSFSGIPFAYLLLDHLSWDTTSVYCLSSSPSSYKGSYTMWWVDNFANWKYLCLIWESEQLLIVSMFLETYRSFKYYYLCLAGIWPIHLEAAGETHYIYHQDWLLSCWIFYGIHLFNQDEYLLEYFGIGWSNIFFLFRGVLDFIEFCVELAWEGFGELFCKRICNGPFFRYFLVWYGDVF